MEDVPYCYYLPAEPLEACQLHVVYERAAVVPGRLALAVQPRERDVLWCPIKAVL